VRLRKRYLLLVALLGASLAVVPAIATSSGASPTINAIEESGVYTYVRWEPHEVTVASSGAVAFQDSPGEGMHGIIWKTGNPETPTCSSGVPINVGASNWSGTCSFTAEGEYRFECAVHHSLMTGVIKVGTVTTTTSTSSSHTSSSTTSSSSSSSTTTTTSTTTQTTTTSTTPPPGGSTSTTAHTTTTTGETPETSLPPVLLIAGSQRGGALHGAAVVPPADRGARLEVDLLATTASLARKHPKRVRIGRFVRASVAAGKVSFSVSLNAQAKRALRRHHRLPLIVEVILTPPQGAPLTTTRSVLLHG
jgi:plastocyanin